MLTLFPAVARFSMLADLFPKAQCCVDAVQNLRLMWNKVNQKLKAGQLTSNSSLDIFDLDLDHELAEAAALADPLSDESPPAAGQS